MKRDFEASDLAQNNTQARPGVLMCACCAQGGAPNTPEKRVKFSICCNKFAPTPTFTSSFAPPLTMPVHGMNGMRH